MHKQAAKNTLILILAALLGGLGVAAIFVLIPFQSLLYIAGAGCIVYAVWIFYTMEKGRLETLDQLNKR